MGVLPARVIPGCPGGRAAPAFSPLEDTEMRPCASLEMCNGRKDRDWRNWTWGLYKSPLIVSRAWRDRVLWLLPRI